MALEAPLRSSSGSLQFQFNQGDMSATSESDGFRSPFRIMSSPPPATDSSSLRPDSVHHRFSSHSMNLLSPSDIVGPSPVTSNGTETTEIEDDVADDLELDHMLMLTTSLPEIVRQGNPEEAVSVIHAPESFASWVSITCDRASSEPSAKSVTSTERSSPKADGASQPSSTGTFNSPPSHPTRPPISTDVKPVRYSLDSATPRAQDLQDMLMDGSRLRSSSTSSLEKIDEQTEAEGDDDDDEPFPHVPQVADEIGDLRTLLHESWTLCNTLANLSSMHRPRAFRDSGTPDAVERAWKACWKLCHRLYDNQDEDPAYLSVKFNLDLCRDFCQALFDVREKKDELADSVLRVSFELNNHLYSAQDNRTLPEQFRERTLDFYITLCHRLMKQRGELLGKTDQLLGACWALAEVLFSLRQNRLDGKPADGELLLSAVQACWGLGDIFKDSWAKVNTDRNTPRPSQASFFSHSTDQSGRESRQSNRSSRHSKQVSIKSTHQEERPRKPPPVPETPVTEFEDTPISPESRSPQMPNLLVLGPSSDGGRGGRWSSSASNLSSYSHSSNRTSSTATTTTATEDPNVARAKILVLRAAMTLGFDRDTITDPKTAPALLQKFVQSLPADAFGPLPRETTLLQQYKNSVLMDAFIPRNPSIPTRGKRVPAVDMAKSIQTLANNSPRYAYLRDLFGFVFKFPIEEVEARRHTSIAV
ncbi:uncharacterized protein TRIVIDRAFT_189120 [Trichoderma virens Gv29-8]|uniref:DUF7624 domain-containing protein n=1 Tax=Hypocrea virens (strain Gv29-8 / FGSC 10586) TaxID=413071 RepID=G9MIG2_HYPVG|nr:uncharacterized protein TRIVIDRAFT_189120 [Trichoderma virens Gv29-8]EHK25279.1 hypothetical protein TRIVIDRAFT_189120 [Trichoderma virens Gv29-8]UKZ48897.1 hypothetical protein TrVGV298_003133 [Trichoderma virens]